MKPNAINYLSLARKAGRIEVGEEPAGAAARSGHARLLLVASDAPDNTRRRAKNFVAGTDQQMVVLPFTKEEMGTALGRTVVALAAMTDPAMALSFLKALEDEARYGKAIEALTIKADRFRRHQLEEKAHQRNLRMGKKTKKEAPAPKEAQKEERVQEMPRREFTPHREGQPPYRKDEKARKAPFQEAGKKLHFGKSTGKESKPAGYKSYGDRGSKTGRQGYATGSKVAGRRFGKKTHGGAEE